MNKKIIASYVISFAVAASVHAAAGSEDFRLWYAKPAAQWNEALPVGNGRMGAMVFGGMTTERVQFNEQTLWTGSATVLHW